MQPDILLKIKSRVSEYVSMRMMKFYDALLPFVANALREEGDQCLGVDFESYNPTANRFWRKHFKEYTNSVTRRVELWCKEYETIVSLA